MSEYKNIIINRLITKIYSHQIENSKKRGHHLPKYKKEELKEWLFNQSHFLNLIDKWIKSNFQKELIPSVDRLDDKKGYSFENIRLVTWEENNKKQKQDIKTGVLDIGHRRILQYDKDGNLLGEYISLSEASRKLNIPRQNISGVCNGKRKTAGKYKFRFKETE